jgi:UDP-glucose 4,6-dehydratase
MIESVTILGGGYVGKSLASSLIQKGSAKVVENVRQEFLNYKDPELLREFLLKTKPAYLINASGYTGSPNVEACETNQADCRWLNVIVPLRIAKVCQELNIPFVNIGSGCIYDGQDRIYSEYDTPNFGLFSNRSSFYSKTKHLCEEKLEDYPCYTFRIRIPFDSSVTSKNYIWKLLKYNNLISMRNSITGLACLNDFVHHFINLEQTPRHGVYNVVNNGAIRAEEITQMMQEHGLTNPEWKIKSYEEMNFSVHRSNCMLSPMKIESLGFVPKTSREQLGEAIGEFASIYKNIQNN